ncbi:hypothetical protein JEO88_03415 [Candidatus Saccharibacteria bacterium]|jgi:hypothetical protein|nr:hypothetical protein [Candidatus Saccharibacteria bacterium]
MFDSVLVNNGVKITTDASEWYDLAFKYGVSPQEVGLIDFNRTGVCLDDNDVRVGFRVRFNGTLFYNNDLSWFALPVRNSSDSNFHIRNSKVYFKDFQIGIIDRPVLDTCNTSYQRGGRLLNLNSRSRSNCIGCKACVHNDKSLYDNTVIKDRHELRTRQDIDNFFYEKERLGMNTSELEQIAVVTGLFRDENETLEHLRDVYNVAIDHKFSGELMYFGCQLMSAAALRDFSKLGKTAIVFAIDNFTSRKENLSKAKSSLSLEDFYVSMSVAKSLGIETTFAYIAGVDDLSAISENFTYFFNVCTRFPVVNIFQIQTDLQAQALYDGAKNLEYYLQARRAIESAFFNSNMRPRRWENYRPLWYREFNGELLDVKAYG